MSRFNSFGTFISGRGGAVSYGSRTGEGVIIASQGTVAQWLDPSGQPNLVIANILLPQGWRTAVFDLWNAAAGWREVGPGANFLAAGGGLWAAWTAGLGLFGSVLPDPQAGLAISGAEGRGYAAPDGTIATVADQQSGEGLQLRRTSGELVAVVGVHFASNVQVIDGFSAIWDEGHLGMNLGPILAGQRYRVAGGWISYYTERWGLVAHPIGHPEIGRVVPHPRQAFHHDIVSVDGSIRVGYSLGQGEGPDEAVIVDALSLPVVDLAQEEPSEPIERIGRPCWLAFFAGSPDATPDWRTDTPPQSLPGNGYLRVADSSVYADDGRLIGRYFHSKGGTPDQVDWLEEQARLTAPTAAIAYLDARDWPRWPSLPTNSWLCVQAYCGASEGLVNFEAAIDTILTRLEQELPRQQVALVPQCYTSKLELQQNLKVLVPVYSRLAKRHQKINMLLPFSGTGRKTGLWEHPEVRPLWEELYAGITGEPGGPVDNGIVDGVLVNPELWFTSKTVGWQPSQYRELLHSLKPELRQFGIGLQTDGNGGDEPSDLRGRLFLPHRQGCPNAAPQHPGEMHLQVHQTGPCCGIGDQSCLQVDIVNDPPTTWTWTVSGGYTMGDYQPVPAEPDPDPAKVSILVHGYDPFVHRSDPKGMLVRFEVESPRPVVRIKIGLDDQEPPIVTDFPTPRPPDGRYFRALAFKPVRNGEYRLQIEATDDQGNVGRSDGSHRVTVVE